MKNVVAHKRAVVEYAAVIERAAYAALGCMDSSSDDFQGTAKHISDFIMAELQSADYVLVPREPTEKMADKGESSLICGPLPADLQSSPSMTWAHAKSCYREMVAVALSSDPTNPEKQ